MNLYRVINNNLLSNLLKSNSSMIMKSNKSRRDLMTPRVSMTKRCRIRLKNMKTESMKCLTITRITTMALKKKKLRLKLICKISLLKFKRKMKWWCSKFKTRINISKNSRNLMLIFRIVPRTKGIQWMRNSVKKEEILTRKLRLFNLSLAKEKESSCNMRILKKEWTIKLRIRKKLMKRQSLNMLTTKPICKQRSKISKRSMTPQWTNPLNKKSILKEKKP